MNAESSPAARGSSTALLTEEEAAAELKVCPRTLRKERQAGRLHYVLIGRCVRYAPDDLAQFIERSRTVVPTPRAAPAKGKGVANHRKGNIVPFSQRSGASR